MPGQHAPTPASREAKGRRERRVPAVATLAALLLLGVALAPGQARAESRVLVSVLRPVPTSATLAEAILRIKSELVAGGFEVEVIDSENADPGPDARALMERSRPGPVPSATIGIFGDLEQGPAELRVVDRITSKPMILRLEVEPTPDRRISEILAIRALELLRASLVELRIDANRPAPPSPPPQARRLAKPAVGAPPPPWALALEIGASTFGGLGGIGPALAPAARLRLALDERFWLRLTALGLGSRPSVATDLGSARVGQNLLLLECAAWLRPQRRLRPVLSLGLGAERFSVEGSSNSPSYQGVKNVRWFAAGDLGTGIALRLQAHWELQLEAHALFAVPRPAVRFFDIEVARAGLPTLLAILTLAGGA